MAITEKYVSPAGAGAHDGSSSGNAFSWAEMITDINAGGKAGNRYNYAGTVSRTTTTDTISGSGTSTSPVIIRGCSSLSSITDGYQGRTSSNGDLVTTNFGVVTYSTGRCPISGTFVLVENMNISSAGNNETLSITGADTVVCRSKISNAATGSSASVLGQNVRCLVFDCDITLSNGGGNGVYALNAAATGATIACNRIKSTAIGVNFDCTFGALINNVIYSTTGVCVKTVSTGNQLLAYRNTIVGGTTDGIDIVTGSTVRHVLINNMITDNGGYGVDLNNAAVASFNAYNRTRDNTSGAFNLGTDWVTATSYGNVTTDTGGPSTDYVNSGSNDYNLIAASPATSAAWFAFSSMGALQRSQTGSGGGQRSYTTP